jgi:hypothetical protein
MWPCGSGCRYGHLRSWVLPLRRGLAALGFRRLSLAVRQVTLPIGLAGLVMLFEEFGGTLVSLGGLVMSSGPMLMARDALVLLLAMLPVHLTHEAKALTYR